MNQGGKLGVVEGLLTFNSKKCDLCTSINCHLSRDQLYKDNAIFNKWHENGNLYILYSQQKQASCCGLTHTLFMAGSQSSSTYILVLYLYRCNHVRRLQCNHVSDKLITANFGHINHFIYNKMSWPSYQQRYSNGKQFFHTQNYCRFPYWPS
jgi:hypothetical protein